MLSDRIDTRMPVANLVSMLLITIDYRASPSAARIVDFQNIAINYIRCAYLSVISCVDLIPAWENHRWQVSQCILITQVRPVPVNPVVFIVAPRAGREQRLLCRAERNLTLLLTSLIYFSAIRAESNAGSRAECKMQICQEGKRELERTKMENNDRE